MCRETLVDNNKERALAATLLYTHLLRAYYISSQTTGVHKDKWRYVRNLSEVIEKLISFVGLHLALFAVSERHGIHICDLYPYLLRKITPKL
jgi:hypothetical protein